MGVITDMDVKIDAGTPQCLNCRMPKPLCKCVQHESGADTESDSETASETTSVGGTESLSLAAGHTCDFEYLSNLAKLGIPFGFDDLMKYDALLQNSGPENIDAILDIGALAYKTLQKNGLTHEGALLRGLVSVWGVDLDPEDTALKAKLDPALKNEPDAVPKTALNLGIPAPSGPGVRT
jgi:hypothetical protein